MTSSRTSHFLELCSLVRSLPEPAPTSDDGVRLDAAIRVSSFCVAVGAVFEPEAGELIGSYSSSHRTRELPQTILAAFAEATLGATADLDPMDRGPAHTALPATVAAAGGAGLVDADSGAVRRGIFEGLELAARVRTMLGEARPGSGFHSVGIFGTLAAAFAFARVLSLDDAGAAQAAGIALSRASGLSLNSAATRLGMSHFGWAAAHGVEAGWLAANDMTASLDLAEILEVFFPAATPDLRTTQTWATMPVAPGRLYFKQYPCNVYLNLVACALRELDGTPDRLVVRMPAVRHLDEPAPKDMRAARNSVQAVAALAALEPISYRSFGRAFDPQRPDPRIAALMQRVDVTLDANIPTDLASTSVAVEAWSQRTLLAEESVSSDVLTPLDRQHVETLLTGAPFVDRLLDTFDEDCLRSYSGATGCIASAYANQANRDEVIA